ncbi:MAG: DUF2281 domain-containing protein, partial [Saprospiraceae bacterium]|nr:DUF2281 domain-containing protein [Saprospiraceae bacterium]
REWSVNLLNKIFAMDAALLENLEHLPPSQQQVLLDFAEYLVRKYASPKQSKKKQRQAGTFKGFLVYMVDDFNAPLNDFKEYVEGEISF